MNGSAHLPTIDELKDQARRLRSRLAAAGTQIGHGQALELLAAQHGYKDWNTLHAAVGNRPRCPVALGQHVRGRYLGQPFAGAVIGVQTLQQPDRYRLTLQFDEPVDVVRFDSFSAFRSRVSCVVNGAGVTLEKTSDGQPHLVLQR
ncbi:MAG: glyoxalase superfamily protein [Alphaproteobacteria bacterium]